ncbi:hypothetical protein OUO20_09690 [Arthrobacter sp. FX8]|uniref:hypothetical protein n=1 Tax=Arthrobacter sp. FX8 TaxID=2997335 RepID=UPI00227A108B|nr:hypothetical protein [Arthrobacter sp. FX8]WAJ35071.1 hypothetical protein OUO20_09690 [Arthrobacter sp. FX8]
MGLNQFGVWDAKLITPTIVWFITVALVSLFRLRRAQTQPHFFRNLALGAIAAPVAVQFVLDMYPFELSTELVLQAGFVVLGILSGFSAGNPEYHRAHQVFNAMIVFLALVVALHSAFEIAAQWSRIDFLMEARKFALPIGMTAAFLPFMYAFALYATYETAAFRMRATVPVGTSVWKPALALALRTGLSLPKLNGVTPRTRFDMARATTVAGALKAFDEGQAAEAAILQEEAVKKQRLVDNAGLQGRDDAGKQLDQREFAETRNALSYLHLCHAGHYRQRGRYRDDMLDLLGADTFAKKGLPEGAVITMHVADDGQQWWAWRRTVTGWVFAIGASEAPSDRWEYDGPSVPSGGPGIDPNWRHFMVPVERHQHW